MTDRFVDTPEPPYFVVIFTSQLRGQMDEEYKATASALLRRVQQLPGFHGLEYASDATGFEMVVAYFADEASIRVWRDDEKHVEAQGRGKDAWYSHYKVRMARVERSYSGPEGR